MISPQEAWRAMVPAVLALMLLAQAPAHSLLHALLNQTFMAGKAEIASAGKARSLASEASCTSCRSGLCATPPSDARVAWRLPSVVVGVTGDAVTEPSVAPIAAHSGRAPPRA